jgi:hypothetical protein
MRTRALTARSRRAALMSAWHQMRSFLLLHGLGNRRRLGHWQRWLAEQLRARGERVCYPQFPEPDQPVLTRWLHILAAEYSALAMASGSSSAIASPAHSGTRRGPRPHSPRRPTASCSSRLRGNQCSVERSRVSSTPARGVPTCSRPRPVPGSGWLARTPIRTAPRVQPHLYTGIHSIWIRNPFPPLDT